MNKESEKVLLRIAEIKESDRVARDQQKFTFNQFLKILGKVDVEVGEDNTENSDTEDGKESDCNNEMQQSSNVREQRSKDEIMQPVNNSIGDISYIKKRQLEEKKLNDSPRLNRNIRVKRKGKLSSVEKGRSKNKDDGDKATDLTPFVSTRSGIPKFENNPPLNLMQFKGVRVEPDKKVIDILAILNNYRKKCEKEGLHLEAKRARKQYFQLKEKEEARHEKNLKIIHEKEMLLFGNQCNNMFRAKSKGAIQ